MENKYIKIMFLTITLLILVMGTVNATDVTTNDTYTSTQSISDAAAATTVTGDTTLLDESTSNDNQQTGSVENKNTNITKQKYEEKTTKTDSPKSYNIENFTALQSALTDNTYDTVTLDIKSDINLTDNTILAQAIKKLTINGNGKTINGNGQYQFLNIYSTSDVTINNLKITNCHAAYVGGAINNEDGNLTIKNTTFSKNYAGDGGAINNNKGKLTITDSTFTNNEGIYGGAIKNINGTVNIKNSNFTHNNATYGGVIYDAYGHFTVNDSSLTNNSAASGGVINNYNGTIIIDNTKFTSNAANDGGVIYNNGQLEILNSFLKNNYATYGGAIKNIYGTVNINNSNFTSNTATDGAIIHNNYYGKVTILNSFLNNNTAENGGIYTLQDITVNNSTFTGNTQIMFFKIKKDNLNGLRYDIKLNEKNGFITSSDAEIIVDGKSRGTYNIIENLIYWDGKVVDGLHEITLVVNNDTKIIMNLYFSSSDIKKTVNSYQNLSNEIENAKEIICPNYIIIMNSSTYATKAITWGDSYGTTNLIINANGNTVYGQNKYNFMRINSGYSLQLNDIILTNFKSEENGGVIQNNYGVVEIFNSKITNSIAKNGGAIYNNYGSLKIENTYITKNTAEEDGGAIYNNYTRVQTITNSNITNRITNITVNTVGIHVNLTTIILENLTDDLQEIITINYANNLTEKISENITLNFADKTIQNITLNIPVNIPVKYSNYHTTEDITVNIPVNIPVEYSNYNRTENITADIPINLIANIPVNLTDNMTKKIPINISVKLSANISVKKITEQSIYGNLTIKNSHIENNFAKNGGAIYNNYDEIINIKNTNIAQYEGLNNSHGLISISDSYINNNNATKGGAIYNTYNRIVSLNNVNVSSYNQLINNTHGSLSISNTQLKHNKADNGGAIYTIYEKSHNNNNVSSKGLIYITEGQISIKDNILTNNTAKEGSAIAVYGQSDKVLIQENTFNYNYANTTGKAIKNTTSIIIENNINEESCYSSTIYTGDKNTNVIINTFIDSQKETTLTYNKIPTTKQGENINITGQLLSDGKGVANKIVQIKVNDKTYNATTDKNGLFTLNYKASTVGKNNITFTFKEDDQYLKSTNKTTFTVKVPTWIKMAPMSNAKYGSTVKLVGRLMNTTGYVKYVNVTATVNDKVYQVKTNGAGYFYVYHTVDSYDVQKVTYKFAGNSIYLASSNSSSFKVKQPTMIKMASMANVKYGSTVQLVGRVLYNGTNSVKYVNVTVTVNYNVYQVKTNGAGYFYVNHTVDSYDVQKVTFKFAGNSLYLASSNSSSFKVKQPTWIKLGYQGNVEYGSTVKLVGRLLNGTTTVKYVQVNVTVNGKVYQVKTDGAGYIRLNYTVDSYDVQKVTFKFAGNSLYLASSNSTTFKVKQPTIIKHASISNVKVGKTVKIVGRVLYNGTNSVKYVPVNVKVNGKVYQLKTDGAGYFRLNYTTTTAGVNNITSSFTGNTLYLASTNSTKFTVVKS